MNINRHNYECYFADYLDGQLNSQEVEELHAFLLLNDDLAELLEEMDTVKLQPSTVRYIHKEKLKKDEITALPDYYPIAIAENVLQAEESALMARHPEFKEDAVIYKQIKLIADQTICYPYKKQLYRPNRKVIFARLSVAATLLLLIGISCLYHFKQQPLASPTVCWHIPEAENIPPMEVFIPQTSVNTNVGKQMSANLPTPPITSPASIQRIEPINKLFYQQEKPIHLPAQDYALNIPVPAKRFATQPEIWLAKEAEEWRSSERSFLNDNIVVSMIEVGKIIGRKIKYSTGNK